MLFITPQIISLSPVALSASVIASIYDLHVLTSQIYPGTKRRLLMASSIIQLEPTMGLGGTSIYYQRSTIASEDMNSQIVVNHQSVVHT